jgi:MSHA biogenesis protein MshI
MSAYSALGPWLRRWRRVRLAAADVVVGAQWIGAELVLARVRADAERPRIDAITAVAAPLEARGEVVKRLAAGRLLRGARLVVLLAPGQYDVHQVAAPAVPDDELRDALRWQLRANLAYPAEEAVLDFIRLPQATRGKRPLLAFTAHKPVVQAAVAPFVDNGVAVDAVDVPEFAQRNLARLAATAATNAWLGFERETCLLTAHSDGELAFARRMLLPGAQGADADAPDSAHYLAERVTVQTQRTLDLFERQSGLPPATEIIVGPHRHAEVIAAALAERSGLAVSCFEPRAAFELGDEAAHAARESARKALAAIGAALREETAVAA